MQIAKVLNNLGKRSRYAVRDRAMFLLSIKAGLRAKEIANLKWSMVTDAEGSMLDVMSLPNKASKGAGGGRSIPMNRDLRTALVELAAGIDDRQGDDPVIASERGGPMNAGAVTMWFWRVYRGLGFKGASSHSGRRTFITRAAKKVVEAGGSLRDVQRPLEPINHAALHRRGFRSQAQAGGPQRKSIELPADMLTNSSRPRIGRGVVFSIRVAWSA